MHYEWALLNHKNKKLSNITTLIGSNLTESEVKTIVSDYYNFIPSNYSNQNTLPLNYSSITG